MREKNPYLEAVSTGIKKESAGTSRLGVSKGLEHQGKQPGQVETATFSRVRCTKEQKGSRAGCLVTQRHSLGSKEGKNI